MVCFTDLWDPDSSRQTINEICVLQPRHLVAAVTLMDPQVYGTAFMDVTDADTAYRSAVAIQVLEDRTRAQAILSGRGVVVVDSPADDISIELVNRYLQIKDRLMV